MLKEYSLILNLNSLYRFPVSHTCIPLDTLLPLLLEESPTTTRISQHMLGTAATPTPQSVLMACNAALICTERGIAVEHYCVCYEDNGNDNTRTL